MSTPPESGETPQRRRIGEIFASFGGPHPNLPGGYQIADAVNFVRQKAERGDAEAQFQLSVIYQNGRLLPQDQAIAREWLIKAADQGHVKAMFNLGVTYGDGLGVPVDDAEAFKWYQAAANEGDPRAHFNLGVFFMSGRGTAANGTRALEHWFEAAMRGMSLAQVRLAISFINGDAGRTDHQLAYIWAYISKDTEPQSKEIVDAMTPALPAAEIAALQREAHSALALIRTIGPNDKRRLSQE